MTDRKNHDDNAGIITHPPVFYVAASVIGLGLDYMWPISMGYDSLRITGAVIIFCLSLVFVVGGFNKFRQNEEDFNVHSSTEKILSSGVFGFSRNPLYLSLLLLIISIGLYFDKVWLLIICVPLILVINKMVIEKEEAYLESKFGDEYHDYKKKVRRWI